MAQENHNKSGNVIKPKYSRYLLPFFDEKAGVSHLEEWESVKISSKYLAQYIREFFFENENPTVCAKYELTQNAREAYRFPGEKEPVVITSSAVPGNQGEKKELQYQIYLKNISLYTFTTGMNFLEFGFVHPQDDSLEALTDKNFILSKALSFENRNKLAFTYTRGEETRSFSIFEFLRDLLKKGCGDEKNPLAGDSALESTQFLCFNRILGTREELDSEKGLDLIRKIRNARYAQSTSLTTDMEQRSVNFYYHAADNIVWSGSSIGAVCYSYAVDDENQYFISSIFPENVDRDYFLTFLLSLHERYLLLHYNSEAVKHSEDMKKLSNMKKEIIKFDVLFSYNTISDEMNYQVFYEALYKAMGFEKLEREVKEVVNSVDAYYEDSRTKKTEGLLFAIALLAIFSALTDAVNYVTQFKDGFHWGESLATVLVLLIIAWGLRLYFKKN